MIIFDYIIKTNNGSYTIISSDFESKIETMHNSNGAITESFEKFVKPFKDSYLQNNNIKDKADFLYSEDISILDICSGLGYNSTVILEEFLKNRDQNSSISIDMAEISIETLAIGLLIPSPIESHNIIKKAFL